VPHQMNDWMSPVTTTLIYGDSPTSGVGLLGKLRSGRRTARPRVTILRHLLIAPLVAGGLGLSLPTAAEATSTEPPASPLVIAGEVVEPGADATVVVPESDTQPAST
jgi:hypothetical protein